MTDFCSSSPGLFQALGLRLIRSVRSNVFVGNLFFLILVSIAAALATTNVNAQLLPPNEFVASWVKPDAAAAKVALVWRAPRNVTSSAVYTVQRRYGSTTVAPQWTPIYTGAPVPNAGSVDRFTVVDTGLATSNTLRFLYYRVRVNVAGAPWSEVSIVGNPALSLGDPSYDNDADGLSDAQEASLANVTTNALSATDWSDGTGDSDGDGVPNAWESALLGASAMRNSSEVPVPHRTVGAQAALRYPGVPNSATISAAISALPAVGVANPTSFRIIRVSPGVYEENVSVSSSLNVAILPARESAGIHLTTGEPAENPKAHFEIRSLHATNPTVSVVSSSLVLDGFILSRKVGSKGPLLDLDETVDPGNRLYQTRLVNCLIRNCDSGADSLIVQRRGRLVLSHCTFYMNTASSSARASVYTSGVLSGTTPVEATARLRVHNCILWNPVNTGIPEFHTVGDAEFKGTLMHRRASQSLSDIPAGSDSTINPVLTPLGYLVGPEVPDGIAGAMDKGVANLHVRRDLHGEWRNYPPDAGAHQWWDDDADSIPNFSDSSLSDIRSNLNVNSDWDLDDDGINELEEYRYGTDRDNADTYFLSIHQAMRMFQPLAQSGSVFSAAQFNQLTGWFYTKGESDGKFLDNAKGDARYWRRGEVIRTSPAGDLLMGDYTNGPPPP